MERQILIASNVVSLSIVGDKKSPLLRTSPPLMERRKKEMKNDSCGNILLVLTLSEIGFANLGY